MRSIHLEHYSGNIWILLVKKASSFESIYKAELYKEQLQKVNQKNTRTEVTSRWYSRKSFTVPWQCKTPCCFSDQGCHFGTLLGTFATLGLLFQLSLIGVLLIQIFAIFFVRTTSKNKEEVQFLHLIQRRVFFSVNIFISCLKSEPKS